MQQIQNNNNEAQEYAEASPEGQQFSPNGEGEDSVITEVVEEKGKHQPHLCANNYV